MINMVYDIRKERMRTSISKSNEIVGLDYTYPIQRLNITQCVTVNLPISIMWYLSNQALFCISSCIWLFLLIL